MSIIWFNKTSRNVERETDVGDVELTTTTCCTSSHLVTVAGTRTALETTSHTAAEVASIWWTGESRFGLSVLLKYQQN